MPDKTCLIAFWMSNFGISPEFHLSSLHLLLNLMNQVEDQRAVYGRKDHQSLHKPTHFGMAYKQNEITGVLLADQGKQHQLKTETL